MGGVCEIENSNKRVKYFKVQSIYISSEGHFKSFYARIMIKKIVLLHQKEEI